MDPCQENEPQVIDHNMITRCLDEQGLKGEMGRLAREEGIPWEEVLHIRLEFMHILRIDHLWVLPGLTMLSLSNNLIEEIQNLESLVNLKELNLSFNKIKKIANLDELVHLEVVNLFNNLIETIENMDNLTELLIFSIGNNKITDMDNVLYLRRFKKLKSVNMAGNPCAEIPDFRIFIATFLPTIFYYEYKMVEATEREIGQELYTKKILDLEEVECVLREREEKIAAELVEAELHSESFVEFLGSNYLFEQMFENDVDGKILLKIDEDAMQHYTEYENQCTEMTRQIFENGQEMYASRKLEVEQFFKITEGAKLKTQETSIEHMESFMEIKDKIFHLIREDKERVVDKWMTPAEFYEKVEGYRKIYEDSRHKTWKILMGIEVMLFEQMEETNQVFEQSLTELINAFIEMAQGYFASIRGLQNTYTELVTEMSVRYLTLITITPDMDIPEDIAPYFVDRDTLNNAITGSHDLHLLVIDNREDRLVRRAKFWLSNLVNDLQKDEVQRNRGKILEINHYLDIQKDDFEDVIVLQEPTAEL